MRDINIDQSITQTLRDEYVEAIAIIRFIGGNKDFNISATPRRTTYL